MRKKIALITGASRGIGRAIALEPAVSFDVVVNYAQRGREAAAVVSAIEAGGGTAIALKAGLLALTVRAARALAADGVAVNAVLPSLIETEMMHALAPDDAARARLPVGSSWSADELATVVRFPCERAPAT